MGYKVGGVAQEWGSDDRDQAPLLQKKIIPLGVVNKDTLELGSFQKQVLTLKAKCCFGRFTLDKQILEYLPTLVI